MQKFVSKRCAAMFGILASLTMFLAWHPGHARAADSDPLSDAQLEQLVAPIALYPDALLAQVLMAATYPLEVVEAARWLKQNPDLKGDALEDALKKESWEASVKSLTAFPQTLEMMNEKLDWTTQLGNAFLAQQSAVMNAVQVLRERAKAAGNLKSNDEQTVKVEDKPTGAQSQTIIIQPASPEVVYVPTYNPTVVYGVWPYPAYAPFYWYPPGYAYASAALSFGAGMAVGSALWGGCNWGRSEVNINVNNYNNFNRTNIKNTNWEHNSVNRRGVRYQNQEVRNRYGGNEKRNQQARDAFRGRASSGRDQIARGGADGFKGGGLDWQGSGSGNRGTNRGGGDAFRNQGSGSQAWRDSSRGASSFGGGDRFGGGGGDRFGGGGFGGGRDRFGGGGGSFGGGRGGGRGFGGGGGRFGGRR